MEQDGQAVHSAWGSSAHMNFHWIIVVWGDRYIDLLLNLAIPSQLSPNNFPKLDRQNKNYYKIYAPKHDVLRMRGAKALAQLAGFAQIEFVTICEDDPSLLSKIPHHRIMSRCHEHALAAAAAADAGAIFLAPDIILSDGALAAIERRASEGYSLLLAPGLSATIEGGGRWLEQYCRQEDGSILLSAQQAARITRHYPQSIVGNFNVSSAHFANEWPAYMFSFVGESSLVCRSWQLHPIYILARVAIEVITTIDSGELLEFVDSQGGSTYLFVDGRELSFVELSPEKERFAAHRLTELGPFSPEKVAEWVFGHIGPAARRRALTSFVYDGGDLTREALLQANTGLDRLIHETLTVLADKKLRLQRITSISEIDRKAKTYIFGCGALGQYLFDAMGEAGEWCCAGFVDSFQTGTCRNFPIVTPEELRLTYQPGDQVVIASMHFCEIASSLERIGVSEAKDASHWYLAEQQRLKRSLLSLTPLPPDAALGP